MHINNIFGRSTITMTNHDLNKTEHPRLLSFKRDHRNYNLI